MKRKLTAAFYQRENVCQIAQELLGKILSVKTPKGLCEARIVETEAYAGRNDKACHANNGKRTKRTEVFYREGGIAYVYLCYGVHYLFNVITNRQEQADAVLIRAVEPVSGEHIMRKNRSVASERQLTNGPGKLTQAMGIDKDFNARSLVGDEIWICEDNAYCKFDIEVSARIGVEYAGEDALKPWRYFVKKSPYLSR